MVLEKKWYALLTRSRFENVVTEAIQKKSIDIFLPRIKVQSKRKDRKKIIDVPLFPGYLFVNISLNPNEHLNVVKTVGAVRLLGSHNGPIPVPDSHIESLKLITSVGTAVVTGVTFALMHGDPVMVVNGPLAGLKGEFMSYKGKGRVIIRIDALGQFAGVEIDEDDIEKLPSILL
ncbi:MAG: UpxY family transcription antiterminator [Desulfamplus sp.]|nr:UpxY family transcription antiterminator [Desulfamplus sp.]MBF0259212.1 UpxY family transcription antiterminator [Desulfamplus sp.]